jgi:hypothetical protein
MIKIAGPERSTMSEFVKRYVDGVDEKRDVIVDVTAPYFGVLLKERAGSGPKKTRGSAGVNSLKGG